MACSFDLTMHADELADPWITHNLHLSRLRVDVRAQPSCEWRCISCAADAGARAKRGKATATTGAQHARKDHRLRCASRRVGADNRELWPKRSTRTAAPAKLRCSRERSARHKRISGPERYARGHSAPELHTPEAWPGGRRCCSKHRRRGGWRSAQPAASSLFAASASCSAAFRHAATVGASCSLPPFA